MKYVLNGSQMKKCDLAVIEGDIAKSLQLIDKASSACIKHLYSDGFDLNNCLVVCGGGNNGADGFAIAKKLLADEVKVVVMVPDKSMRFSEEALILKDGLELIEYDEFVHDYDLNSFSCIVDALFGIGLSRDVEGKYANIIEMINEAEAKILSVDIPSGISSDNGSVMKAAVNSDITVTFACFKTGQLLYPGRKYCGKLYLEDIGIPVIETDISEYSVTDIFDSENCLPERVPWGNKGTFGKILVIAGSSEIFGAAYLSAMAAYKSGSGMVHILTEKNNMYSLQQMIPEALLHFYDENDSEGALLKLESLIDKCDIICAGSGMGMSETSVRLVKRLIESDKKTVFDADALNIIAKEGWMYKINKGNCIVTPHIMEMSRLSGLKPDVIKSNIITIAEEFSNKYNVVMVLKDAVTVVSFTNENTYINRTGNCAMAKAGSGDVLAGIIAGLLGQGMNILKSAQLGVYVHGLIGDKQVKKTGEYGLMASNLLEGIEYERSI